MAVQKPTKQQVAQAKARAGGNNPIKVTNSGLKKLGSAALLAASFTPVGRAAKVATTAVKASNAAKTAKATKTLATPKSAVKVKPAAKQKPNKPNESKMFYKVNDSGGRAYNRSNKEYDAMPEAGRFGSAAERQAMAVEAMRKAPVGRKTSIVGKKLNQAEARKATTPKNNNTANPWATRIKINSASSKTAVKPSTKRK